jgi:DNA-3-methyladenine glycosylase II
VEGVYERLLVVRGVPLLVRVGQLGPVGSPRLRIELVGRRAREPEAKGAARELLDRVLGAAVDVRPFYRAVRQDPVLGPTVRPFRGMRIAGRPHPFEALVTAVLSQQVNLRLAYGIRADLVRALGRRAWMDGIRYHAFPAPARIASSTVSWLRDLRLSRAKAETLLRLAGAFADGRLSDDGLRALPDEEVVARLVEIKGVGRWTAEMALLRGLGRLDAFPGADLGVVKSLARDLLGRNSATEAEMRGVAERWRPYRGLALVYAYGELSRRLET